MAVLLAIFQFLAFSLAVQVIATESSPLKYIPQIQPLVNGIFDRISAFKSYAVSNVEKFHVFEKLECDACEIAVQLLHDAVGKGASDQDIVDLATHLCITFKIEDEKVCNAITIEFENEFIYVLKNLVVEPKQVCGIVLGDKCATTYDPWASWNVTFPNVPKPPVKPPKLPKKGSPVLRILHLTDIHGDPLYKEGSNAVCGEPLCCREGDGPPAANTTGAGKWGDYRCDVPYRTIENLFQHLSSIQNQFDIVYFTGDIPPHDVWNQTRSDQLKALRYVTNLFLKYLPHKPVFHTLGNHESAPVNSFPPPFVKGNNSISWLYSALADSWQHWLPKNTTDNIIKGAFYTVSLFPGLRIISLNMNYCNNENWWLLINSTDPAGQLKWFISVLQEAENNKEKVHILGHIAPGFDNCMKPFDWNYFKIINRYESTVAGQFFGHSHSDLYQIIYDSVDFKRPIGTVYIPGSVTTYTNLNPGFRIYQVDGNYKQSSWVALNYQNYIMDLEEVNKSDKPEWKFEYDAKVILLETIGMYTAEKDLKLEGLYPEDWNKLIYQMRDDDALFQKYYRFQHKMVDSGPCTGKCKKDTLCNLKHGRSHDNNPNLCSDL